MTSSLGYPSRYIETLLRAVSPNKLDLQSILSNLTSATAASAGPLDNFYARIGALNGPFFPAGWGNLSVVNYEEDLQHLIAGPPSNIKLSWRLLERGRRSGTDYLLYEGTFRTPCLQRVFDALPPESRTGRVQLLMPAHLQPFQPRSETPSSSRAVSDDEATAVAAAAAEPSSASAAAPAGSGPGPHQRQRGVVDAPACVVHLAATGDQTFGRRLRLGFPLLKDNVCSLVLESPFYGARRPAAQRGSKLQRVSDLLTLGWATIAESINLLHWLREEGYGALGMCGLSMGGVHASMTAGLFPGDVAVTPLLAPRSAAVAYCDGAMRAAMAWEPLLEEVDENNNRITQVVMAAGRAVRVELPVAVAATGPASGAALAGSGPGPGPGQCVALMREATYALVDLEVRGEKRHLAAAEPGSGSGSNAEPESGSGSAVDAASVINAAAAEGADGGGAAPDWQAAAAGSTGGGGGDGAGGGGGAGLSLGASLGLPFVSVMDLQSGLARAALQVSGNDAAAGLAPASASAPQGGPQQSPLPHHADSVNAAAGAGGAAQAGSSGRRSPHDDFSGPFSGVIAPTKQPPAQRTSAGLGQHLHESPPQHPHPHQHPGAHAHQHQRQHPQHKQHQPQAHTVLSAAVGTVPPGGQRPHPPPHQPDMPFPSPQHTHQAAEVVAAAGSAGSIAAAGGTGGGGGGTVLGRRLLGDLGRAVKQLRADDRRLDRPDTVLRLKQVLETYTDITRYPRPRRTDAAVIVAARDDAYVSTESVRQLHAYWGGGSELRMVSGGHVSAFLMHQEAFRTAIRDSLARVARPPPPPPPHQP
ncbi:hypothetical protein PLESTM_001198100 [Pleodorina starrii]|nr:hypothetical protein PLESTM_001198100 [Pleodorina starrii]